MPVPPTKKARLVSGASMLAWRPDSTMPAVAEVGAAHRVEGEVAVGAGREACEPQTKETSNSSSTARTAMDAATAIAVSKSSGSDHDASRSSTTIVAWLRRVSRYWRTSRADSPVEAITLADERQWMWRRSSPGTYSRSAWKARSLWLTASVETPSRSRIRPAPRDSIGTRCGRTSTSRTGVQTTSREKMPTGSPRRVIAGPTAITPRRSVRMVKDSSCVAPGASELMP